MRSTDTTAGTSPAGTGSKNSGASDARPSDAAAPHLVRLVSVETDAREEESRVVWELEQRPVVRDQYALPSPAAGFDAPDRPDAFLDAVREAHVEVDEAVVEAYGWTDLDLRHGFHETRQGVRFTIDPVIQTGVLDRLLELNHARYKEEQATGIRLPSQRKKATRKRKKSEPAREEELQDGLSAHSGGLF